MLLFGILTALFCSGVVRSEPPWDDLRVTWGLDPFNPYFFAKMDRTESGAKDAGFTKLNDDCAGGNFLGYRYIEGLDTAAVLIYDVNGYIAGIQFGVPKKVILDVTLPLYENIKAYQLDKVSGEDVYFVTAYFVNPNIICNGGRTEAQFQEGTGTGLYFQNGSNPIQDSIEIPMYEKDLEGTKWVKGGCIPSMGLHYWYDVHADLDCSTLFPFTGIYNQGKLTDFAFFTPGNYTFSKRVEHPPLVVLPGFLPLPIPQCITDEYGISGGYTTMHVYFNAQAWNLLC